MANRRRNWGTRLLTRYFLFPSRSRSLEEDLSFLCGIDPLIEKVHCFQFSLRSRNSRLRQNMEGPQIELRDQYHRE